MRFMRSILSIAAAVLVTACLNSTHPAAQRAQARHDIAAAIAADRSGEPSRRIVEIRDVTGDSAVVFTEQPGAASRRQERWVRGADGWKLDTSSDVAGPVASPQ